MSNSHLKTTILQFRYSGISSVSNCSWEEIFRVDDSDLSQTLVFPIVFIREVSEPELSYIKSKLSITAWKAVSPSFMQFHMSVHWFKVLFGGVVIRWLFCGEFLWWFVLFLGGLRVCLGFFVLLVARDSLKKRNATCAYDEVLTRTSTVNMYIILSTYLVPAGSCCSTRTDLGTPHSGQL